MAGSKFTRTHRYLLRTDANSIVEPVPAGTPPQPTFVHRLGFRHPGPKAPYNELDLADRIARASGTAFFCDNSIFDDRSPHELWTALLDGSGEAFLTPLVRRELEPWADSRPTHPVSVALRGTTGLQTLSAARWSHHERNAYLHYINILAFRKVMGRWGALEFARRHGAPPTSQDGIAVDGIVSSVLGERGMLFARKGAVELTNGTISHADEELVYVAVAHAIRTGQETFILTRDEDVLDQFYRLIFLLDSHYRSMLIAKGPRGNYSVCGVWWMV